MRAQRVVKSRAGIQSLILGEIRHGSHICAFYETEDDLIDLVLPFFEQGVRDGDACVWALPEAVDTQPSLRAQEVIAQGAVELRSGPALYLEGSRFARDRVVAFWNEKLQKAIHGGCRGIHASGDAYWLHPSEWDDFLDYEADLSTAIADRPISLLCTYPLSVSKVGDILDVACAHHVAIAKRRAGWEIIKGWSITERPCNVQQKQAEALEAARLIGSLSRREQQVLRCLIDGRSSKVIAYDLGISVRTVEMYRSSALDKLMVRTSAEAIRLMTLASLIREE